MIEGRVRAADLEADNRAVLLARFHYNTHSLALLLVRDEQKVLIAVKID